MNEGTFNFLYEAGNVQRIFTNYRMKWKYKKPFAIFERVKNVCGDVHKLYNGLEECV